MDLHFFASLGFLRPIPDSWCLHFRSRRRIEPAPSEVRVEWFSTNRAAAARTTLTYP